MPAEPPAPQGEAIPSREPMPRRETILVVDDEDAVRELVRDALAGEGYTVIATGDPLEAQRIAASRPIHLLLADVVMPAMTGLELAERVEAVSRETKVLLMSGFTTAAMKDSGRPILTKPFTIDDLLGAVHGALDRSAFPRPEPR
jgi:two-component system, cell cycle sensor histidine kinase and response regulator CckA